MLASLLFPYDEDAPSLIDGWISELEREGCVVRYKHDTGSYIQICNWLSHQKIDRPSQSKLPSFDEYSRILANPREPSSEDQGSRKGSKDQGPVQKRARTEKKSPDGEEVMKLGSQHRVRLTNPEYEKFVADHGEAETLEAIQFLDDWIVDQGDKSKAPTHRQTMDRWVWNTLIERRRKTNAPGHR